MVINYGSSEQKAISNSESEVEIVGEVCEPKERFSNQLSIVSTDHIESPSTSCHVLNDRKEQIEHSHTLPSNFTSIIVSDVSLLSPFMLLVLLFAFVYLFEFLCLFLSLRTSKLCFNLYWCRMMRTI